MDLQDNVVKKELQRFVQETKDTMIKGNNSLGKKRQNDSPSSLKPWKQTERDTEKKGLMNVGR